MDLFDVAQEVERKHRELSISRAMDLPKMKPTGSCRYCDEPTDRLFCNAECRDSFEFEERMLRRNGE